MAQPSTSTSNEQLQNDHAVSNSNNSTRDQSNSDHQRAATTTNLDPTTDVPTMGYPPAIGYPHPPYGQPYYPYPPPAAAGGGRGGSSFVRGFLATLLALTILTCVASIATWLVLRPQVPAFRVESVEVTGLDVSGPRFSAQWDARLAVENPNKKLRVYLDQLQGYVYHKQDFLSSAAVDPAYLPTEGREALAVRLRAGGPEQQHLVGRWVADEIAAERALGGAVSFNLRMLVLATFKSGQWWTKHASMKVFCEDLRVVFAANQTRGVFSAGDKPKRCVVYYA